jgi:hypothetical protein
MQIDSGYKTMKRRFLTILILGFLFGKLSQAQSISVQYDSLSKKAYKLYETQQYKQSAQTYNELFKIAAGKELQDDRYNAGCAWALAGYPDSAFFHLQYVTVNMGYNDYNHIIIDGDLNSLHADKRWLPLLGVIKTNKDKAEGSLDKSVVKVLDEIYADDQSGRVQIDSLRKIYGMQSDQVHQKFNSLRGKDSINLIKVKKILDKYGWVASDVLFMVMQHADLASQKQYLPMMKQAVTDKKLHPANLALFEDRIAVREGKKQIYGSQLRVDRATGKSVLEPIEDEANVNKRRSAVGLEPLENYAARYGIDYHVPAIKN